MNAPGGAGWRSALVGGRAPNMVSRLGAGPTPVEPAGIISITNRFRTG